MSGPENLPQVWLRVQLIKLLTRSNPDKRSLDLFELSKRLQVIGGTTRRAKHYLTDQMMAAPEPRRRLTGGRLRRGRLTLQPQDRGR